eukprot:GHVS01004103.1.p3 GENE.GHVS01004103.1~~GHVS01004103.1.p3  ORF type:complete len:101 (-),score=13.57 GHVS01004103.1:151-453(-)
MLREWIDLEDMSGDVWDNATVGYRVSVFKDEAELCKENWTTDIRRWKAVQPGDDELSDTTNESMDEWDTWDQKIIDDPSKLASLRGEETARTSSNEGEHR